MKISAFTSLTDLTGQTELEKVRLLAFYYLHQEKLNQFGISDICQWFDCLNFSTPNQTRLLNNLKKSNKFIKGTAPNIFRLHAREIKSLETAYPGVVQKSEEVTSPDHILSESLYQNTRGFIENLSRQINACFDNNSFDACAVLMRRLLEILLILSFDNNGIQKKIQDPQGEYLPLNKIITEAISNSKLNLSRNSKSHIEEFKTLGNFAAHKIYFNTRKSDVSKVILEYRAVFEELLYKSGIKT